MPITIQGTNSTAAPGLSSDGDTGVAPGADEIIFSCAGAEKLKLNSSGNLVIPDGAGLDFSAAAGAGATSSLFHDYEEGHYTPAFTTGAGSCAVDSSFNQLAYTKVGRVVHIFGEIKVGLGSGLGGTVDISLPYTTMTTSETSALGQFAINSDMNINNTAIALFLRFASASALARFVIQQDDSTWDDFGAAELTQGKLIAFSGNKKT